MSGFSDFIFQAETIDLTDNKEFNQALCRLFEAAKDELLILSPDTVKIKLLRINESIEKYRIVSKEYSNPFKINLQNEIEVFRFKQLLGYSFHVHDSIDNITLDNEILKLVYVRMSLNMGQIKELKKAINLAFPNIEDNKPINPKWLKDLFLFSNHVLEGLPQLSTNLTKDQRGKLFDSLVQGEFIPNENKDCFIWALGKPDEKQPDQWQPIIWKPAKQLLRELLEAIKSDNTIKAEIEKIAPLLFIYKGKSIKLAKNKVRETQYHKRLIKIIATL